MHLMSPGYLKTLAKHSWDSSIFQSVNNHKQGLICYDCVGIAYSIALFSSLLLMFLGHYVHYSSFVSYLNYWFQFWSRMPDSVQDQRSAKSASTGSSKAQDDSRGSRISSRNSSQGYGTSRDSVFTASSPDGTTSTSNFSRGGNRKSARLTNRETYANGKCVMPEAPSTTPYEKKPCSDDEEDSQAKCGSKEKTKKSARRRRKKQDEAAKVSKIVQNKL